MWSDFMHLWRNREQPSHLIRSSIVWLKGIYHLLGTGFLLLWPALLRRGRAQSGRLVILGKSCIQGDWSGLSIGDKTSLGRCESARHDKVNIGCRVVINEGVQLFTAFHFLSDPAWGHNKAPITIGEYAWIASNVIVLPWVTIGRGAVVGAGAVVGVDVPDYCVAIGKPARLMPNQGTGDLNYAPVILNAPFEA